MKKTTLTLALLLTLCGSSRLSAQSDSRPALLTDESPKFTTGNANPLLDFTFIADPTSVEYNGRLYVYGTYDTQQLDSVGPEGKNSYEHIHSLAMLSTDDMVNWTWHGIIDVGAISPWGMASWAPSIISRVEADGKTHFYLYYSNSGTGVGMLTSTSPVGPWSDPLGHTLIWQNMPGLGHCPAPFDPGAVIDGYGTGWLAFGGGGKGDHGTDYMPGDARIVRLGDDLCSLGSDIVEVPTPYHFEAQELDYIDDTWVYTYNTDWQERPVWPFNADKPTRCCMSYLTSRTPLDKDSWQYQDNYFKNPGDYGMEYSNNHTHLQKYKGQYYLIYHNLELQGYKGIHTGYRSICIDRIQVDEHPIKIHMTKATREGVPQIQPLNPFGWQQAETTAATVGVRFEPTDLPGNMVATGLADRASAIRVRGVDFSRQPKSFKAQAAGKGTLEVRIDGPDGPRVAVVSFDGNPAMSTRSVQTAEIASGVHDLYFLFNGTGLKFDAWRFGD